MWTGPNGEDYIQPGEYTVTEKIAPPGFELSTESQNLRLWIEEIDGVPTPMSSGPITFENKPLHSIIIQKVDESGQGLPGAVFNVYLNGAKVDSITTGPDGTFTYAGTDGNGLQSGTWGFEEVKAPDGYLLPYNKYQSVTIDAINDDVRVHQLTFVNYTYPEIVIKKVSAGEEQPLAGAVFEVMIDGTNLGRFGPTGPDGTIIINHDIYGKFLENDNQDTWTVQVREVEAPDGHLIDSTPQTFEIRVGQTEPVFLVFGNDGETTLYIRKEDAQTRLPVADAVFELRKADGEIVERRLVTGPDGLVSIDGLEPGDYIVREIEAPPGYLLAEDPEQIVNLEAGETETVLFRNNKPGGLV